MSEVTVTYHYMDVDVLTLKLMGKLGHVLKISKITDSDRLHMTGISTSTNLTKPLVKPRRLSHA